MEPERQTWSNRVDFILSMIGYAVGLSNILRFPYLAFSNGGGAFLIPYTICLIVCGIPLYYLELAIGQASRRSCLQCWSKFAPILTAAGYVMTTVNLTFSLIYHANTTWILYYLGVSLTGNLPWTSCNQTWNTDDCVPTKGYIRPDNSSNDNGTVGGPTVARIMTASEQYWENHVLEISDGISTLDGIRWQLCIPHFVGWLIVLLCIIKGVRSVGKIVWITATAPYIMLIAFIIRVATLPGSLNGIKFYLIPDYEKLLQPRVWLQAFLQIFLSFGCGMGSIITMASFNKKTSNFTTDAILVPIINCLSSFFAGFATFGSLGFLASKSGIPVASGPGLAYVTYPEIAAHMPAGSVWSVLFFLMLFTAAVDSEFVSIETCVSIIQEHFDIRIEHKQYVSLLLVGFYSLLGLVFTTRAGVYLYQLIDWYLVTLALFFSAAAECLGVVWLYGFQNIRNDVYAMTGRKLHAVIFKPLWGVVIPVLLLGAMLWTVATLTRPTFGQYEYPEWACALGWLIAVFMVLPAPVYIVVKLISFRGPDFRSKWRSFVLPVEEKNAELTDNDTTV